MEHSPLDRELFCQHQQVSKFHSIFSMDAGHAPVPTRIENENTSHIVLSAMVGGRVGSSRQTVDMEHVSADTKEYIVKGLG